MNRNILDQLMEGLYFLRQLATLVVMEELMSLKGKIAVVTGGAKGIGKATSQLFAKLGALVYILDIDEKSGNKLSDNIGELAIFKPCDLADHKAVGRVFDEIESTKKCLDILVNNAGIAHIGTPETTTEEDFNYLFQVNVKSAYSCLHFGLPLMKESGGGAIVNMSSVAAISGVSERFAYSVTKGALHAMTVSVAKDYVSKKIRCNSVGPARIHTPFIDGYVKENFAGKEAEIFKKLASTQPIGRMGEPEEVAQLIAFLCSDASGSITGSFYPIDGGFLTLNS